MSIGSDDIEKLAVLSRLAFEADELGDITDKLGAIVAFVDQLKAADTGDVEPMAHPLDQVQRRGALSGRRSGVPGVRGRLRAQ